MATPPKVEQKYRRETAGLIAFQGAQGREVAVRAATELAPVARPPNHGLALESPEETQQARSTALVGRVISSFRGWPWLGSERSSAAEHHEAACIAERNGLITQRDHHLHLCFDVYLECVVRVTVIPWLRKLKARNADIFRTFLKDEKRQGLREGDYVWDFTAIERYGGTVPRAALKLYDKVRSSAYQPFLGYLVAAQRLSPLPRPVPVPIPDPDPVLIGIVRGEWGYREWYVKICEWV